MDDSAEMQNIEEKVIFGARVVNPSDPDVFDNPDSARVRARQIGCIGIRRYNNRSGAASWMPCTNESDYRRVSGIGHSGRRFRRQEIEREVRRVIGGRGGRKVESKSANYTKPEVRETLKKRIMAGSKGGNPGQWSARKAQLLAIAYRKAGGGYKGGKTKKQRSLSKWTKQKWRTSDGKLARRGNVTRRYLPAAAWNRLTVGQRAATNRKKIQGSREGRQFVQNTEAAKRARKRSTRGQKHIEFYEDFEFKAIGSRIGKVTRRRNFGSSTGGRAARRIGGKLRGAFATFDPNAIDADGDLVVQEGTIQERRIAARVAQAAQRAAASAPDNIGRIRRQPQIDEERAFGRAERLADGRYATTLPSSIARTQSSPRKVRRGFAQTRRIEETKPQKIRQSKRPEAKPTTVISADMRDAKPKPYPPQYERDAVQSIRESRPEIYRQFITGESTVAEIADRFDVVRDEIQQAINQHKKLRKSNRNKFTNNNPRLTRAIEKFSNSRNAFTEAISEGRFRDWDSMVQYVFRNPDSSKNRDNMVQDLFDTFKTGKNPDRSSNISLGYVPSNREDDKRLVKTFSDSRKPRPGFRGLDQFETQPKRTASAASFEQRAPRSYRRDDLIAEAMSGGYTITGKMSGSMTPKQEQEWKRKEWKRQQLKGFAIDPNASTKFPSLNAVLAGRDITKSIEALDALDDTQLDNLWTSTIGDISSVPGMTVPAYQAKNAPLSPRELALAASVKRPLVKAFVDEYKKFNASGLIAGLDIDSMSDADVQSFFNTFILPELTNTGSPSVQDVEQAAQLLPAQARLSDAERLLTALPSSFQTLEYRMKVGRKTLVESGYDVDTPEFDAALQKFLDESEQKDLDNFNEQLTTWLNGGKPTKPVKKIPINPDTNEKYTEQELRDQIDAVSEALELIQEKFNPELFEELQAISGLSYILNEAKALETFLNDPTKIPDEDMLPVNVATGQRYTLREWIESGAFKLFRMFDNPATQKPFTEDELDETLLNLELQRQEITNKIGPSILSDFSKLERFNERLIRALAEVAEDEDEEFDIPEGDLLDREESEEQPPREQPSIEELQQQRQDILDQQAQRLQNRPDVADEFTKEDIKNIRDTISSVKKNQEPGIAAPDTDEFWEKFGPYDGDPNHPLNKVTNNEGEQVNLNSKEYQIDKALWNEYLAGIYAQEWSDIHNTHIIARYTDVPDELAGYSGTFQDGADPALIDPNIRWDKLIDVLQQTNPELFRRDPKTGEIIGETLDNLAQQLGLQNYGGASFSARAGQAVDASGEIIDTSGPQYRRLLGELAGDERLKQNEQYLGSTKAAAKERAKLWNLLEVGTLTPDEIAFQEGIRDINTVVQALNMHEVDNNIPSVTRSNLDGVARTAFKTRKTAFEKAKTKKLIDGIRELAQLSSPGSSATATANNLRNTVDKAIARIDETIKKIGVEYDQFRRTKQMMHGFISSLLKTRPGLFEADPKNPNQRNRFGQTGWNRAKEPLLRYMNRLAKWDEEMFGYTDRRTGERRRGLLQILVDFEQSLALQTGDPAGSSATTAIYQRATQRKVELERFKAELQSLSQQAQSQGITGFMKRAGALGRAEDSARRGARRAAEGRFGFADPRILKRYDRAGFNVTKPMLGNASGFNKRFNQEIQEAIRNNNLSMENSPAFKRLNQNEKSYMRLMEAVNNTPRLFGNEETPTRARRQTGRIGQAGLNSSVRIPRYVTPYVNRRPTEFYKSGITGRMDATSRNERIKNFGGKDKLKLGGFLEVVPEELEDGRWYMVNRHGEIMSPESYPNEDAAYKASLALGRKFREQQRGQELPQNTAEWEAARLGLRQSGYRAASVHRQNLADIAPIKADGTKNEYMFAVDKRPKQRAGDALIIRKNPSTGALEALVIERGFGPHRKDGEGTVALPGGFFDQSKGDADLFDSALREALEETGLRPEDLITSQKLGTIDSPDWDPRFAEGIEVSAVLVEVPSTWEPTAGDDAESARFVPLADLASGDIPLGFGHAAWFDAAFSAHEDPELSSLGTKFSHLNWLARQRQQRIIRDVNELRVAYNAERLERDLTLFDQENPRLKLFPTELPDTTNGGWRPTGSEFDAISKPRVARIIKDVHAHLDALINADRAKRGLPPKRTKKNLPEIPPGAVSGAMRAAMTEMGPDEFDKVSRLDNGRDNPAARKFIDDVINLRMSGMDKYSIAKFMSDKAALEFAIRDNGNSPEPKDLVRSHNSKADRGSELAGLAPTDELIFKIIAERKLNTTGNSRSRFSTAVRGVEPQDKFTKQRNDAGKDVMTLALEGMSTSEIADILDISKGRVGSTLRRMGMQDRDGSTTTGDMSDAIRRYEQSPNQKAMYVDSMYKRLSLTEIAKKYNLPESEVRESIEAYRNNVEALQPQHHEIYRKALTDIEADVLTRDEEQIARMRLDGLSISDISDVIKMNNGKVKTLEQRALYKLRRNRPDDFMGVGRELDVINHRKNPSMNYMVGGIKDIEVDGVYFGARDLRDFRNNDKDMYMMNQHMGSSVKEIAARVKMSEDEVRQSINSYLSAVETTDTFKHKALRRVLATNNSSLSGVDIDFVNMRNDGASVEDMARYFEVPAESVRARQISVMSKLNNSDGISGAMKGVSNIDSRNLYRELGVEESASQREIEDAFTFEVTGIMSRAMRNEPNSVDRLFTISEAYKVLSNPAARESYDNFDFDDNDDLSKLPELDKLFDSWPMAQYVEPSTNKVRPPWVADAILGEYRQYDNFIKMPHHLGSDEITDDIDDGFLGFDVNDSDRSLVISDMYYQKPIPGTKEWDRGQRLADRARASGDTRISFDKDGFISGSTMNFDPRFDDPQSPVYIGDRYGGPPKGSSKVTLLNFDSPTSRGTAAGKKKFSDRSASNAITGRMKGLVPKGSWSIGETVDGRIEDGFIPKHPKNSYWQNRGYDTEWMRPWADLGETLAGDYLAWLDLPEDDENNIAEGNLGQVSRDVAAMGNLKTASLMDFSPRELLDDIDELYENMPKEARMRATARTERDYGGLMYYKYPNTTVRPFLRHVDSVPLLKDIASGKVREFVYYDRRLFPGKIINRDGDIFLTNQRSFYNPETTSFEEMTEEISFYKQFETELPPVQLSWDEDPKKAETYLKAVLIGAAISGPWLESNSSNIETQLLHQAVRRVFDLTDSIDSTELPGARGSYRLGRNDDPDPSDGESLLNSLKGEYPLPPALKNFLDDWVRTTYEQTQEYLNSIGEDDYIHLYRGASLPEMIDGRNTEVPEQITNKWMNSGAQAYDNPKQLKEEQDFKQAPISSWTLSPAWARVFSYGRFGPEEAKVGSTRESTIAQIRGASVIDAPIPKRLILSLPHSGLGTLQSGEIIVVGETLPRVRIRHSDSLPMSLWYVADSFNEDTNPRYQEALNGKVWSSKGQRHFVADLRGGWGDGLVYDGSAEQYLAQQGISGKMKSGGRSLAPYRNSGSWNGGISGQMQSPPPRDFAKRAARSLKDDNKRYPFDSRPSESDMRLIESASQNLRQTEILPMAQVYDFEFSGPDGELYNSGILTLAQRPVVVVRFYDEINVPFYMSSGRGGKRDVEPGRWYPFWGVGRDGWFNKTTERDINNFYNIPELRVAAARLDAILPQSSMPTSNTKWNNGDLDWMPREKMSISERQKRFRAAQRAIREAEESIPDGQRRASKKESKRFVGFPIKDSLIPVINSRRNAIDRNGDVSLLAESISSTRKAFNNVRKEIFETATQDRTSSRRGLTNERAKRIVRDMPDGVFDTSVVGRMAIPKKQWSGRDFYKDLDADKNDSLAVLKKKFREIAKKYHPDRNKGDVSAAARFRAASEAWEILSDARQRSDYDNNFYPEIERRAQQNRNQENRRADFPFGFTSQRDNQAPQEEPSETRTTSPAPPRPPYPNPRSGATLPPLDKTLSDRIGYVPPSIKHDPQLWDSMKNHRPGKKNEGIEVPDTFGQGKIKVTDDRFFDLYTKVAVGMSDAVKKNRKPGEPKRFISVGGAPGSGKSTMRKSGEAGIPDVDSAVHVDADEIKTIIPEAAAAHAAGDTEWGTVVHEESRVISDMALRVALDKNKDIVYDSTGQYNRGYGTLDYAKEAGYEITAHYVVAPEEFLQERIDMRQLTDPRKLPRHIIAATIARNFNIIPEVAEKSDEFYLWGWDGNKKVLLAKKEKGKTLEILDQRAFAHANFFKDYGDHPLVDKPDLSLFPNRRDLEFPSSWVFDAHKMFEKGATVSKIAKELKQRKSDIFRTLTEDNVVGYPPRQNTGRPWPGSPFSPRSPRKPDGPPRPIYEEDDITEDPWTDDIRDVEEDYYETPEDDSFADEDDMPIPGQSGEPITIIDGMPPMNADDPAPDMTRYKSSGILAQVAKSAESLTSMFKYAKQSTPFRKLISDYLREEISYEELVDGLTKMRLPRYYAGWASGEKDSLSKLWPFDDEKLETLTDNEITEYAEDVLGDGLVKKLEQAFTEMSAVGVVATDPIGRKFAWEYSIPMSFMKSAQAKFDRKGTIKGAMDSKNPFGDPSTWKSLDDLDDELKDYMVDDDMFGKAIKHPLLFWIGPVAPNMIDYLNNGIDAKRKGTEGAYKEKNWGKYIYLHERAYRIQAFEEVMDEMTDEQYWENLSSIWVDSESIGTEPDRWLELLQSNRGSREFFMNEDERAELDKLPNKFTVYRGYSSGDPEEFGMSWSTSEDVAEWFARRFVRDEDNIILEELQVAKEEVFAYLTRRGEEEIILDMRIAKEKSVKRTKLGPKRKGK